MSENSQETPGQDAESKANSYAISKESFVDTTYLLGANSAIFPTARGMLRDREAEDQFKDLLNYICNGGTLYYGRPNTDWETNVPIMDLLTIDSVRKDFVTLAANQDQLDRVALDFCLWTSKFTVPQVESWVRFQFDDPILEKIFFEGGGDKQIDRLMESFSRLKSLANFAKTESLWNSTVGSFDLHGQHFETSRRFESPSDYALAYGFFGYAKGWLYPVSVKDSVSEPHFVHPIRRPPLRRLGSRLANKLHTERLPKRLQGNRFPMFDWGRVLLRVGKNSNPEAFRADLVNGVAVIRALTTEDRIREIHDTLPDLSKCESDEQGKIFDKSYFKEKLAVRHDAVSSFVFEALEQTPWRLRYRDKESQKRLVSCVFGAAAGGFGAALAGGVGVIAGLVIGGITGWGIDPEAKIYRKGAAKAAKIFNERGIWSEFDDSQVSDVVSKFAYEMSQ